MMRWVVTGPAGAGKSALTKLLAERGAVTLDGDRLGHEILDRDEIVEQIGEVFGAEFVVDQAIDRRSLGRLVFADAAALEQLNGIVHGPLCELMEERLAEAEKSGQQPLAVLEAAVYFLLPSPPRCDLTITVTAESEIRQKRLIENGLTEQEAQQRIAGQANLIAGHAGADVILRNEGSQPDLARQADEILSRYGPATMKPNRK